MTVYDLVRINAGVLRALADYGITPDDVVYVEMFADYRSLVSTPGVKVTYAVAALAERYRLSERQVWRIVNKFKREI